MLAIDRPGATELWRLSANDVSPTKWNDDWDGSSLVLGDYLFEGGENSQMHVVKLNRGRAPDGTVTVAPSLVWNAPGWDDQLLAEADNEVSIENSVAILGRHALLRQLRRARAGLGHLRVAHRLGAAATCVPLLDR